MGRFHVTVSESLRRYASIMCTTLLPKYIPGLRRSSKYLWRLQRAEGVDTESRNGPALRPPTAGRRR